MPCPARRHTWLTGHGLRDPFLPMWQRQEAQALPRRVMGGAGGPCTSVERVGRQMRRVVRWIRGRGGVGVRAGRRWRRGRWRCRSDGPVGSHNRSALALCPRNQCSLPLDSAPPSHDPRIMLWHMVLLLISPLVAPIGRLTADDRDREIRALRQQVLIPQRQFGTRPRLMRADRLALLLTCFRMKKQQLLSSLLIVKPATLIGWRRQIVLPCPNVDGAQDGCADEAQ